MPPHPLARRAPRADLGRYGQKRPAESPTFARRQGTPRPPKVAGQHRWVSLSWHHVSHAQALAVARDARFNPDIANRIAVRIGCLDCGGPWDEVGDAPCPAPAIETVPEPSPTEPAPAEPEPVPVDPPTPPDAGPPVVTGDSSIGALAEPISETPLSTVRVQS